MKKSKISVFILLLAISISGCNNVNENNKVEYDTYETEEMIYPDNNTLSIDNESTEKVEYETEEEEYISSGDIDENIEYSINGDNIIYRSRVYYELNKCTSAEYLVGKQDEIIKYIINNYVTMENSIYSKSYLIDNSEESNDDISSTVIDKIGYPNWIINIYEYGYKNVMTVYGNENGMVYSN